MIRLTRLNGSPMYLNADLIATIESHHDTVVTLVDGKTYVVAEPAGEVVASVTSYRASVLAMADTFSADFDAEPLPQVPQLRVLRNDALGGE